MLVKHRKAIRGPGPNAVRLRGEKGRLGFSDKAVCGSGFRCRRHAALETRYAEDTPAAEDTLR